MGWQSAKKRLLTVGQRVGVGLLVCYGISVVSSSQWLAPRNPYPTVKVFDSTNGILRLNTRESTHEQTSVALVQKWVKVFGVPSGSTVEWGPVRAQTLKGAGSLWSISGELHEQSADSARKYKVRYHGTTLAVRRPLPGGAPREEYQRAVLQSLWIDGVRVYHLFDSQKDEVLD